MKYTTKPNKWQNLSVEKFWLPLTQQFIDNHNTAWTLSQNDDEKYCMCMMLMNQLLLPTWGKYVDLLKFTQVFIYVVEFIYGNPYDNSKKTTKHDVSTNEMFEHIKRNWNVNIDKELQRVKNKLCQNYE